MILQEEKNPKWLPYIVAMSATAIISALGTELAKWLVDELKAKKTPVKKEEAK